MQPDLGAPKPSSSVGGTLCLDFINANPTSHGTTPDNPAPYTDLTAWGLKIGWLSKGQAKQLEQLAQRNPKLATDSIKRAQKLREVLKRVFSSLAAHLTPAEGDLEKALKAHTRAIATAKLVHSESTYRPRWAISNDTEVILHPISHDAIRLLSDASLEQVKACPDCGWLFVDSSKNGSRRWCSMDTCGARDKMRRYHQRKH